MKQKESITEFYTRHQQDYSKARQFNVYRGEEFSCDSTSLPPNRRDFYKISMITKGTGILSYADKSIKMDRPSITFLNPLIPIPGSRLQKIRPDASVFSRKILLVPR